MGSDLAKAVYLQVPVDYLIKESGQLGRLQDMANFMSLKSRGVDTIEIFIGDQQKGAGNV